MTGTLASQKAEGGAQYESALERDHYLALEFDPTVVKVVPQPVVIHYRDEQGKRRRYTPDTLVQYRGGRPPGLFEVKYIAEVREKREESRRKFRAARAYAREQGWTFTLVTERTVRAPHLKNAHFLRPFLRRTPLGRGGLLLLGLLVFIGSLTVLGVLTPPPASPLAASETIPPTSTVLIPPPPLPPLGSFDSTASGEEPGRTLFIAGVYLVLSHLALLVVAVAGLLILSALNWVLSGRMELHPRLSLSLRLGFFAPWETRGAWLRASLLAMLVCGLTAAWSLQHGQAALLAGAVLLVEGVLYFLALRCLGAWQSRPPRWDDRRFWEEVDAGLQD